MIFGENLLALLVLALGAALAVGNLMALLRPRPQDSTDATNATAAGDATTDLERPPLIRTLAMIALGLLAAIWALASLATADDDTSPDVDVISTIV